MPGKTVKGIKFFDPSCQKPVAFPAKPKMQYRRHQPRRSRSLEISNQITGFDRYDLPRAARAAPAAAGRATEAIIIPTIL